MLSEAGPAARRSGISQTRARLRDYQILEYSTAVLLCITARHNAAGVVLSEWAPGWRILP